MSVTKDDLLALGVPESKANETLKNKKILANLAAVLPYLQVRQRAKASLYSDDTMLKAG